MPHLYFFAIDVYYYKQCFENVCGTKEKEIFKKMPDMHDYTSCLDEIKLLTDLLNEIKGVHLSNLNILENGGLHTDLVPDAETTEYIFEEIEKRVTENDIISIYDYRGCGQHYVFKDNGVLKVSRHCGDYGREFPPESTKYFFDNKLGERWFEDDADAIYLYEGFDVFAELYNKNEIPLLEGPRQSSPSGGGIYIDTNEYHAFSQKGITFNKKRYLVMEFMADEDYEDECEEESVDYITIVNKKTGEMWTAKCNFYESSDRYGNDFEDDDKEKDNEEEDDDDGEEKYSDDEDDDDFEDGDEEDNDEEEDDDDEEEKDNEEEDNEEENKDDDDEEKDNGDDEEKDDESDDEDCEKLK